MKSLTSKWPLLGIAGLVCIVAALFLAWGIAAGLFGAGVSFLLLDYRAGE